MAGEVWSLGDACWEGGPRAQMSPAQPNSLVVQACDFSSNTIFLKIQWVVNLFVSSLPCALKAAPFLCCYLVVCLVFAPRSL